MRQMRQMRGRPLRYGASLALSALMLFAAGCSVLGPPSPPVQRHAPPQIFREALPIADGPTPIILDPALALALYADSYTPIDLLFDGLVTLNRDMTVRLWGARGIDISPDGLTYTFYLRPGQFFSDGAPVYASDYAYSINRTLSPCLVSSAAYNLFPIASAQTFASETCRHGVITPAPGQRGPVITTLIGSSLIPDDAANILTIKLQQPSGYFLAALTHPEAAALEASVVGTDIANEKWTNTLSQGATGQGGSGMYYLRSWDQQANKLVLAPNPHWWGLRAGMPPTLTEIDLTLFSDTAAAYAAYQAGQVDGAPVPSQNLPSATRQPDYHQTPQLGLSYLLLNWQRPPFNNLDARLAFCLAINRDAINQDVYGGAMLPTWHLVPQGMPGYLPTLTGPDGVTDPTGDAARAQAHWHAYLATLHGKTPPSVILAFYPPSNTRDTLATALQEQWFARLNLIVPTASPDPGYLSGPLAYPNYQATLFAWLDDYPDPQDFLSLLAATGASYNEAHASLPAADALLQRADAASNPVERLALYNQAEQLLVNQVALCPLLQNVVRYQLHSWVHGWSLDPEGIPANDTWLATTITAH